MDAMSWIPWLALGLLASFSIAVEALFRSRAVRDGLRDLREKVSLLEGRLARLDELAQGAPPVADVRPANLAAPQPRGPVAEPSEAPPVPAPPLEPAQQTARFVPAGGLTSTQARRLEQLIVENWLVWLGGIALALGGAFLVKLSIDYGWLTPVVRVVLGVVLGFLLSGAAEWVIRRDGVTEGDSTHPSYIPQALAASGCTTVFASLYAAHQLYGLLPSALAFPLLAGTAAATLALSLRHGPFVAALGVVGAFAVPLLVQSNEPHAIPLFAYLTLVSAGAFILLQYRAWFWLAWVWLAGAVFWVLLWLAGPAGADAPVVGCFLLIQFGLFAALRLGVPRIGFLVGAADSAMLRGLTQTAFWALALAVFVLVQGDHFGTASLACAVAATVIVLGFACRDVALDRIIVLAGALPIVLLATWALPAPRPMIETVLRVGAPEQIAHFAIFAIISAVQLGGLFLLLPRVARPGRWAALSAAAPLVILAIAYWRLRKFGLDIAWSVAALALAGAALGATASLARRRTGAVQREMAIAAYAVAVLGATILAAVFALSNAWLTVALALHLPALGWVEGRVRLPVLRRLALGVAVIVLVRLAGNPWLLDYPLSPAPIFNWLLYGYGVPALAFIVATRQFGSRADDLLVKVLEAGAILFVALFLTLEIRHFFYGRIDAPLQSLARDSVQVVVWLGLAWGLLYLGQSRARPVLQWGGIGLFALASLQAVLWQAFDANPLATGMPVGRWLVFDTLTLAYAAPALIYAGIAVSRLGPATLNWAARGLAIGFALLWVTLENRHAFRGEILSGHTISDAEWYAYSTVWLAAAGALLAVSLIRGNEWLRRAALVGIGLVAAKVFLSDMAQLAGVLRALSFLGLGSVLIGIGYAYRRLRPLHEE